MKDRIVLLTKDALCKSYLPVYGNKLWDMPNLTELAQKGTVFNRFYASAPSTSMSFISMCTQLNCYETKHKKYDSVVEKEKNTIFDKFHNDGYDCHIIWDQKWIRMAKKYSECYGEHTKFNLVNINQAVGAHCTCLGEIENNDSIAQNTVKIVDEAVLKVVNESKGKLFLWIHLPHVLLGRNCYGGDMDLFDQIIGNLRKVFSDDSIFISADHGNMSGTKNKISYGFDVYESAINIPLITPRIDDLKVCDTPMSNIHIYDILKEKICVDDFVYSDCAYYEQLHRKLAIIHGDYKYIYNKESKTEELYDLQYDPNENCNIVQKLFYDVDRKLNTRLNQVYYYPKWEEAEATLQLLRNEKNRIWRQENIIQNILLRIRRRLGYIRAKINQKTKRK